LLSQARAEDEKFSTQVKARLDLAKKLYQRVLELEAQGSITPPAPVYEWSKRWLEAELDLSVNKTDQVAAYAAHLDRMKLMEEKAKKVVAATRVESVGWAPQFYRLEAETWLAKAKQKN